MIDYVYSWYFLLYMIGRTAAMFMCAAAIHDAAFEPVEITRTVSSEEWGSEVQRFYSEIIGERPALTGMKFFSLTRRTFMTVSFWLGIKVIACNTN